MSGFYYNGHSTATILPEEELMLVSTTGAVNTVTGVTRESIEGEPTISRPIVNEYGTNAEHLEFAYSLMKASGTDYTHEEQRIVETWLTSPKYSSDLTLYDCDGNEFMHYYGKFISTEWVVSNDNFIAVNFTFLVNGTHGYQHHVETYGADPENPTADWSFDINCHSDELEEWVYPKVTISRINLDNNVSFTLINTADNNRQMKITTNRKDTFYIDCQNNILSEESGVVDFEDLGWSDVGDIYWLRLKPGINHIDMTGAINIKLEYDSPVKYVGGWLI